MVAKTLYGLEEILAEELLALGANDLQIGRRMVSFTGDKELLYKANFHCRTALRVLKPIYHFKAKDADTVYKEVKKVEWEKYLSLDKTFAIDSVIYSEDFNHSKFVAYRTKDAIVDYFIEKFKKRPSVRVNNPDLYINIHISHNDCTLSIDSSGESLHKRGYRVDQTEAPLNEVLAAGMILKTGWKGESNFVDRKSPLIPGDPIVWRKNLSETTKDKIYDFFMNYGKTPEEKAVLERLGWAPFRASSDLQLVPIRQLALFKEMQGVKSNKGLNEQDKLAKTTAIQAQLDDLDRLNNALSAMSSVSKAVQ